MKLSVILLLELTILIKCIKSETIKRVLINEIQSNNNNEANNGSLDVKMSAEYGVENTENDKAAKVIQIFPENYNRSVTQLNDLQSMETAARTIQLQNHNPPHQTDPQNRASATPSLNEIQNVVNSVESNPNEQNKPSKIVQVLRVPAIYELHMQAGNQNLHSQNLLMGKLIMSPTIKLGQVQQTYQQPEPSPVIKLGQVQQQELLSGDLNQQENLGELWQQQQPVNGWSQLPAASEASYNSLLTQNIPGVLYLNVPQASYHYMSPVMDTMQRSNQFGYNQMSYPQMMYTGPEVSYPQDYMSAESTNFGPQTFDQAFVQNSRKFVVPSTPAGNNQQENVVWNAEEKVLGKPQAIHEVPAPNLNQNPKTAGYSNQIPVKKVPLLTPPPPPLSSAGTTTLQKLPNVIYGQPLTNPTVSTVPSVNYQPLQQTASYNVRGMLDNFKMKPLTSSYKIAPPSNAQHQSLNTQTNKSLPKSNNFLANNQQQLNNFYANGLNDAFSIPTQHVVFIEKPIQDQYNIQQPTRTTTINQNFDVNKALEGYLDRQLMEPSTQSYEEEIVTRPTETQNSESTQTNQLVNEEVVTNVPHYQVGNQDQNIVPNINLFLLKNVDNFENQIQPNLVSKEGGNQNGELIGKFESLKLSPVMNDSNKGEYTGKPMVFENIDNTKRYYENQPKFVAKNIRNIMYPRPFGSGNRRSGGFNRRRSGAGGYVILIKERTFD